MCSLIGDNRETGLIVSRLYIGTKSYLAVSGSAERSSFLATYIPGSHCGVPVTVHEEIHSVWTRTPFGELYHTCDLSILQTLDSRPPQSCPFNVMTSDKVVSIMHIRMFGTQFHTVLWEWWVSWMAPFFLKPVPKCGGRFLQNGRTEPSRAEHCKIKHFVVLGFEDKRGGTGLIYFWVWRHRACFFEPS